MAIGNEIFYEHVDQFSLDPKNPRLGREKTRRQLSQDDILDLMKDWTLEELAVSFIDSGFWPHEALLVVKEKLQKKSRLVVVEGNRRLAALKFLKRVVNKEKIDLKWRDILKGRNLPVGLFEKIPYIIVDTRGDVESFLGFRHVTGIKEWKPAEKAEYIARLIERGKKAMKM